MAWADCRTSHDFIYRSGWEQRMLFLRCPLAALPEVCKIYGEWLRSKPTHLSVDGSNVALRGRGEQSVQAHTPTPRQMTTFIFLFFLVKEPGYWLDSGSVQIRNFLFRRCRKSTPEPQTFTLGILSAGTRIWIQLLTYPLFFLYLQEVTV